VVLRRLKQSLAGKSLELSELRDRRNSTSTLDTSEDVQPIQLESVSPQMVEHDSPLAPSATSQPQKELLELPLCLVDPAAMKIKPVSQPADQLHRESVKDLIRNADAVRDAIHQDHFSLTLFALTHTRTLYAPHAFALSCFLHSLTLAA
jgi:hypothetical protein